jgi:hypothetical protein
MPGNGEGIRSPISRCLLKRSTWKNSIEGESTFDDRRVRTEKHRPLLQWSSPVTGEAAEIAEAESRREQAAGERRPKR